MAESTSLILDLIGRRVAGRNPRTWTRFHSFELSSLTFTQSSMRNWSCLLVTLVAAAAGAAPDQQVSQQYTAQSLKQVQTASEKTNSTANLISCSVSSLLQQLPNTRHTNGMITFQ